MELRFDAMLYSNWDNENSDRAIYQMFTWAAFGAPAKDSPPLI